MKKEELFIEEFDISEIKNILKDTQNKITKIAGDFDFRYFDKPYFDQLCFAVSSVNRLDNKISLSKFTEDTDIEDAFNIDDKSCIDLFNQTITAINQLYACNIPNLDKHNYTNIKYFENIILSLEKAENIIHNNSKNPKEHINIIQNINLLFSTSVINKILKEYPDYKKPYLQLFCN